jgi:predicted nucleic acid-binding protein
MKKRYFVKRRMSPKGLHVVLKDYVHTEPLSDYKYSRVAIDVDCLEYLLEKKLIKKYHEQRFSAEYLKLYVNNPEQHCIKVKEYIRYNVNRAFKTLGNMFLSLVLVRDKGHHPRKIGELNARERKNAQIKSHSEEIRKFYQNQDFDTFTTEEINVIAANMFSSFQILHSSSENVSGKEADELCVRECMNGNADVIFSPDYDVLTHMCSLHVDYPVIRDLNQIEKTVNVVHMGEILQSLDIDQEQFVHWCILSGTDYGNKIPGIGPKRALDMIKRWETLCVIEKRMDLTSLEWRKVREVYAQIDNYDPSSETSESSH